MNQRRALRGFIRLKKEEIRFLPLLKRLNEFESVRVSGPGSFRRDIGDVLWTKSEIVSALNLNSEETAEIQTLIEYLQEKRQILRIPMGDGEDRYITRVAEIVRLLGHDYEYWHKGRPGVSAVRWLIQEKTIPKRNLSAEEFRDGLIEVVESEIGSGDTTFNLREAIGLVVVGVAEYLSPTDWRSASFSEFQLESTREMLLSQFHPDYDKRAQIITAGVGSGKTIAFSTGLLVSAVEGILGGEEHRRCHLLLYPRTALARDQFRTLQKIAEKIWNTQLDIHFEHYKYYKEYLNQSVINGIEGVYGGTTPPPSIIVTTLETIKRRLQHPRVVRKLSRYLRRIVLDEIHLVEGLTGSHVVQLMNRIRAVCENEILWTAASATVARPDLHSATVFGIAPRQVKVIEPRGEDLETVGLSHHIFLRPSGQISLLGTLVNSTSILVHNRRDNVGVRDRVDRIPKTIGFADNLDLLGRWNADLRENERTENVRGDREHPYIGVKARWNIRQKEVPYALRFKDPLDRRIKAEGGVGEQYGPVLQEFRGESWCSRCRNGERIFLKRCDEDEMRELGMLVYRDPHESGAPVKVFRIANLIFESPQEVGTLDLCPYLRSGACFIFPQEDFEVEEIPHTRDPVRYEWSSVARSSIHSSKTSRAEAYDDDLGELVFKAPVNKIYDIGPDREISIDIILSSPSLEVGIDLHDVTESIMFKAIRNVASYRQKVGRVGREEGSDVMNVSLMSMRPVDLHFYRQPQKLISRGQLDPIPLKEYNASIMKCGLYMAVWDFLALRSELPEAIPLTGIRDSPTDFTKRLLSCRDYLENNKGSIAQHLSRMARPTHQIEGFVDKIIEQIKGELDLLLTRTAGVFGSERLACLSDVIAHILAGEHGIRVPPPRETAHSRTVKDGKRYYHDFRPRVNPIALGLSEEFHELDRMSRAGWIDLDKLREIHRRIEERLDELESSGLEEATTTRDARKIPDRALKDIEEGLEGMMIRDGETPIVREFYEQFRDYHGSSPYKARYLSYLLEDLRIFELCRKDPSFVRPKNLFTDPYEGEVSLISDSGEVDSIPLGEALFSLIPGTWTYRLGKEARKVEIGRLDPSRGGLLTANLSRTRGKHEFTLLKKGAQIPLGFPGTSLDIYCPTKLSLKHSPKYLRANPATGRIKDGDEEEKTGTPHLRTKVPQSYLERWVEIVAKEGERIKCNELDVDKMVIEDEGSRITGEEILDRIRHPMLKGLIRSIDWHRKLEVYDYVYSASRSYTSRVLDEVELMFQDESGPVGFGRKIETEGVSIELEPETVKETVERIRDGILSHKEEWAPSALKAFNAALSKIRIADGTPLSPFLIRDLIGVLLSFHAEFGPDVPSRLTGILEELLNDEGRFRVLAEAYYRSKAYVASEVDVSEDEGLGHVDSAEVESKATRLIEMARELMGRIPDFVEGLEDWIRQALLNTFGMVALTSLQKFTGTKEGDIGYSVDLDGMKDAIYRIFLYDRTQYGNGSCEVLKRYLHILNIQRHGMTHESRLLPSEDYLNILEQELLQCPQHHTDVNALEMFAQSRRGDNAVGLPEFGYVAQHSEEVLRVSEKAWLKMGIRDREDAWKLPIIAMIPDTIARSSRIEADEVVRASNICWNGCPECVLNRETAIGLSGAVFLDKALLDEWFRIGRGKAREYKVVGVENLAGGEVTLDIGKQSRLSLEYPRRRIRSISLPYTLGFEHERTGTWSHPQLIVRDDDVASLKLFDEESETAHGIESIGFKRIIWYNLLTTAYLDILGLIETDRKEILMVFYDCRDVNFDDVGFSPRMREAIDYHRKKQGEVGEMERLSDVLAWLAKRDFHIRICLDEGRSRETEVRGFLQRLSNLRRGNIELRVKRLPGSMHKKALVAPLGALHGSANLTESGAGWNEEIINYAPYGTRGYEEMKVNVSDTFHGSEEWRGLD